MDENQMKRVLSLITNLVRRIVKGQIGSCVKRAAAIVINVENEFHYATVVFPSDSLQNEKSMRLMNCTGKNLVVGDKVMIEYTYDLSDAFIAIKNDGKPWGW